MTVRRTVHLIVNPVAGHAKAPEVVTSHVIPILDESQTPYKLHTTTAPRDAGTIGRSILDNDRAGAADSSSKITVIIAGGDGTTHEFIEGVLDVSSELKNEQSVLRGVWEIVILPFGTANALYSSLFPPTTPTPEFESLQSLSHPIPSDVLPKLYSLFSFLDKSSTPLPLPITLTTLVPPVCHTPIASEQPIRRSGREESTIIPSHVVLSTSLHACILQTSETLRAAHPGPERFRIAAQQSASRFFEAKARLSPPRQTSGEVEQWDPKKREFVKPYTHTIGPTPNVDGRERRVVEIGGPFAYFLSTSTVDRLEPTFVVSPKTSLRPAELTPTTISSSPKESTSLPGAGEGNRQEDGGDIDNGRWIYVTILRPLRDPRVIAAPAEQRGEVWSRRAFEVLGKAYQQGTHIDLTYPVSPPAENLDDETESRGQGDTVVELFRCGSFEWIPLEEDERTRLVCADGALHLIPIGGHAEVGLKVPVEGEDCWSFAVWA
ncbi:hypothetical protein IAR55_006837 [Kwoniella newhampshirensis]|uniref:DAGKc domain-containing protein n=1 Tax=Kwoniella newhampshirensis TaxID=1651941 RepID=A0AAW0YTT9_9TREE